MCSPLSVSLKPRMPLPSERPISGRRLAPNTSSSKISRKGDVNRIVETHCVNQLPKILGSHSWRMGSMHYYAAAPVQITGAAEYARYSLISGCPAPSTVALVSGLSKPWLGVGLLPISRSIAAAWRASICTMLPAAASTCLLFSDGAAPL